MSHEVPAGNDAVDTKLAAYGLAPLQRPAVSYPPIAPEAVMAATNVELGAMYAAVNAWGAYARENLAQVEAYLVGVRSDRAQVMASLRKALRPEFKGRPSQELDDEVALDPHVVELTQEESLYHQLRIRLEAMNANIENDLKFISRSIELRRQDLEQHRTETAMPLRRLAQRP